MSAPVDVRAVLRRHVALAEQVGCREQQAEAHALFDVISDLIAEAQRCCDGVGDLADLRAALRAVGGAE